VTAGDRGERTERPARARRWRGAGAGAAPAKKKLDDFDDDIPF
jgi:hypothetical protein